MVASWLQKAQRGAGGGKFAVTKKKYYMPNAPLSAALHYLMWIFVYVLRL